MLIECIYLKKYSNAEQGPGNFGCFFVGVVTEVKVVQLCLDVGWLAEHVVFRYVPMEVDEAQDISAKCLICHHLHGGQRFGLNIVAH